MNFSGNRCFPLSLDVPRYRKLLGSFNHRRNDVREVVPRSVQPTLYGTQITASDVRYLLVGFSFHLSKNENDAVVLG